MKQQQKTTNITIGVIAVCIVGLIVLAKFGGGGDMTAEQALLPQDTDRVRGNASSVVVLTEYADFQCPACSAFAPILDELVKKYNAQVKFVFRHFPLTGHDEGYTASTYAEAAHVQGKFFEFGDLLYEKQSEWGATDVRLSEKARGYAELLGLNADKLMQDAQNKDMRVAIDAGLSAGNVLQIPGTPTFFLQGKQLETPRSVAEFSVLIDAELAALPESDRPLVSTEDYASIAVFVNGKRIDLSEAFIPEAAYMSFADAKFEIIKKEMSGQTLGYLFEQMGGILTDTCITMPSKEKKELCTDDKTSLKFYINGLPRKSPSSYSFNSGDTILISFGPLNDPRVSQQILFVPSVPCEYTKNCVK